MSDPFELVNLGDTFGGYYRASDEDWARVLQTGLVVLDTNALLDLYRLSRWRETNYSKFLKRSRTGCSFLTKSRRSSTSGDSMP